MTYTIAHTIIAVITLFNVLISSKPASYRTIASREISLEKRYPDKTVNEIFKKNILLTLAYLSGKVSLNDPVDWSSVTQPSQFTIKLESEKVLAFHDIVLPEYKDDIGLTTKAHFNISEGFKSDGYLAGDGVCHLASLLNWIASDARLGVNAPTDHDFAIIPEVPTHYGTSIYTTPTTSTASALQNLYIKNTKSHAIYFDFMYNGDVLKISISESTSP